MNIERLAKAIEESGIIHPADPNHGLWHEMAVRVVDKLPAPKHPEDVCRRCGGPNLATWHAPSPFWNTVMRDSEGREQYGVVCPRCFGELAQEKGVADSFCLTTHDPKVTLPTTFGDGRVWNPETCMWETA